MTHEEELENDSRCWNWWNPSQVLRQASRRKFCGLRQQGVISPSTVITANKTYPPHNEQMLQSKTANRSVHLYIYLFINLSRFSLSWWDARANASPTGHTHARTHKEWTAVGLTQDYLCLTCLSPTAARCSWPSRCFSLSFFLSFYSSLFHTHLTRMCACVYTHTQTHARLRAHTHLSATQYFVIKRHRIWSVIKQMWLCKQCCFFKQHIGLSTTSPHALRCSSINACMKTYMREQMHTHKLPEMERDPGCGTAKAGVFELKVIVL